MVVRSYGAIGRDENENVFGKYKDEKEEESSWSKAKNENFNPTKLLGIVLTI